MKRLVLVVLVALFIGSCVQPQIEYIRNSGQAHGTSYHVIYQNPDGKDLNNELKKVMRRVDKSLSTYDPISVISRVNQNDSSVVLDEHFVKVFNKAMEISKETYGAFDLTVAPLVNAWGFGFTDPQKTDAVTINGILQYVGYSRIELKGDHLIKDSPKVMLDASAIAKGYSVDLVSEYLERKGIENYMVEIGGEVRFKGVNAQGNLWRIGIDEPSEDNNPLVNRKLQRIVHMTNNAMATSGNYRQYYIKNGKKYAHTINPKTGYPVQHRLLSVSVVAPNCMTADAYATAFMVLGYHASNDIVEKHPEMEAYFILDSDDGEAYEVHYTDGMEKYFKE